MLLWPTLSPTCSKFMIHQQHGFTMARSAIECLSPSKRGNHKDFLVFKKPQAHDMKSPPDILNIDHHYH